MKKILFAAAMVAVAATSCMTNEEMDVTSAAAVASSQDGAISFYSGTSGSTKATAVTTKDLYKEKFDIYSYVTEGEYASVDAAGELLYTNIDGDVLSCTSTIWSTVESYFWPVTPEGSTTRYESFFAFTNSTNTANYAATEFKTDALTYPSFEYTVQDVSSMEDILAANTLNQTSGTVALDFYHALAKVNFSAVGGGDGGVFDYRDANGVDYDGDGLITNSDGKVATVTADYKGSAVVGDTVYTKTETQDESSNTVTTWEYTLEGTDLAGNTLTGKEMYGNVSYTYTVKSIEITDLYDEGTFTFGTNSNSANTPGNWTKQGFAGSATASPFSSYTYDLSSFTDTSVTDDNTISLKNTDESNSLFIMPQANTNFTIKVGYTVQRNDIEVNSAYKYIVGTATTPEYASAMISTLSFVENSNTLIKMTLPSPGQIITFKASVGDWASETTADVNIDTDIPDGTYTVVSGDTTYASTYDDGVLASYKVTVVTSAYDTDEVLTSTTTVTTTTLYDQDFGSVTGGSIKTVQTEVDYVDTTTDTSVTDTTYYDADDNEVNSDGSSKTVG